MEESHPARQTYSGLLINKVYPLLRQRFEFLIDIVYLDSDMMDTFAPLLQELGHTAIAINGLYQFDLAPFSLLARMAAAIWRRVTIEGFWSDIKVLG